MRYGIPGMHILFPSGIFRKCTSAQWLWHQRTSQFCFTKAKAGKRRDADIWEDSKIKKLILPFFSQQGPRFGANAKSKHYEHVCRYFSFFIFSVSNTLFHLIRNFFAHKFFFQSKFSTTMYSFLVDRNKCK